MCWSKHPGPAAGDGREMTPETPFLIASVTKLYIAAVILQLSEQRLLELDAPMSFYLSGDLVGGLHRLDGVDHTPTITIRHLLSHTSGLPDYIEDAPRGGRSLFDRLADGSDTNFQLLIGIIEAVTGLPVHQVFHERIFGPLNLGDTYMPGRSHPDQPESGSAMLWSKDQPLRLPLATPCFNDLISTGCSPPVRSSRST